MSAFYNEHDPKAAAWIRELIAMGEIAPGVVDHRSITEIQPHELNGHTHHHFFSGIAGWAKALDLAGWDRDRPVWSASLPCQPFSVAGQQRGAADDRNLWPAFFRLVCEHRPECIFGEQVAQAIGFDWLDGISADLEAEGYAVGAHVLGAHSVGAPHRRQRLYWVAYAKDADRRRGKRGEEAGTRSDGERWRGSGERGADGSMADAVREGREGEPLGFMGAGGEGDQGAGIPVGDAESRGRGEQRDAAQPGRGGHADGTDDTRRLGEPDRAGRESGRQASASAGYGGSAESAGGDGGVDDSAGARLNGALGNTERETRDEARMRVSGSGRAEGFWDDFTIIPCRDGKYRRIESGTFPLVARRAQSSPQQVAPRLPGGVVPGGDPGVSEAQASAEARVMRLRGYGNAICVPLAAEFIRAAMEAMDER